MIPGWLTQSKAIPIGNLSCPLCTSPKKVWSIFPIAHILEEVHDKGEQMFKDAY